MTDAQKEYRSHFRWFLNRSSEGMSPSFINNKSVELIGSLAGLAENLDKENDPAISNLKNDLLSKIRKLANNEGDSDFLIAIVSVLDNLVEAFKVAGVERNADLVIERDIKSSLVVMTRIAKLSKDERLAGRLIEVIKKIVGAN